MNQSDWTEVVIKKKAPKAKNNEDAIRIAKQNGTQVETIKKYNAGKNQNRSQPQNASKLEAETEELAVPKINHSISMRIQQARLAAKMTQKDLATKINEKPSVVNDYEAGKGVPNNQILGKMEKVLGVKLRGNLE